ncbi:hypothetical protein P3T76_010146 [Phytophthora citrophthora]|uniref:Uncharacterized protein n=1 Tax=Phytophthora citrophthora TaxID=4793 RepID=A0AAD9LHQ6_9STRA|nr:hypothetical protein P3T76_010146 [Phytophthora citrophthora]
MQGVSFDWFIQSMTIPSLSVNYLNYLSLNYLSVNYLNYLSLNYLSLNYLNCLSYLSLNYLNCMNYLSVQNYLLGHSSPAFLLPKILLGIGGE